MGTSSLAVALAGEGVDVCGVDFSQEVVSQMERRHPELSWYKCDAMLLHELFPAGCFDCIVAKTLLDCLTTRSDADIAVRKFLEAARTVLSDNGRLVLVDRTEASWLIQRGEWEILAAAGEEQRPMVLRILTPLASELMEHAEVAQARFEAKLRWPHGANAGLTIRRIAAGGAFTVLSVDGVADAANFKPGDRILAVDGTAVSADAGRIQAKLASVTGGDVDMLVERRSFGGDAARRRASSQDDYLL